MSTTTFKQARSGTSNENLIEIAGFPLKTRRPTPPFCGSEYNARIGCFDAPTGRAEYIEVIDGSGKGHRFSTHPRREVLNEHPLSEAWKIFHKPEWLKVGERERDLTELKAFVLFCEDHGIQRPLIISRMPAQSRKRVLMFRPKASIITLLSVHKFNLLLVQGLTNAFYTTNLWSLFLTPNGSPAPITLDYFDFVYKIEI